MITIFLAYGGLHEKVIARFQEISCSEGEFQEEAEVRGTVEEKGSDE
ncbi:hypothetical protein E2C01_090054 [Portunus trituberculatus]|uniref:Uncharacterized protein n=1 Tax=Portunus trituberculatus TaxID=210409 RepID=A0A5B7JJW4_PORTR|nr:hypothetical protein [Portunus trituberculatus]